MTYLQESVFMQLPKRKPRLPRQRFVQYYRDLYAIHQCHLSEETFLAASQYSYAELGEKLLDQLDSQEKLHDIELLLIVTWAHEFDPDYGNVGAYFVNKYQLNCRVFDISDQGSLAFFTAVSLLKKYLASSQLSKALILVMEQTTIPCDAKNQNYLPKLDAVCAFIVNKEEWQDYAIQSAGTLRNNETKLWKKMLNQWIGSLGLMEKAHVVCKQESVIHQQHLKTLTIFPGVSLQTISNQPGNALLLSCLSEMLKQKNANLIVVLEEDVETNATGYFLLRKKDRDHREL